MDEIESILIALLVSVAVLASAARAAHLPYPIVLVLGGSVLGVVPGLPDARLNPDLVLVIFLTFCVIAVTLVGQGLTLPYLIRKLDVSDGGRAEREELKARLVVTKAAIARIDELGGEEWTRDDTIERMRGLYEYRKRRLAARAGKVEDDGYEDRSVAYQTLFREVLEAQRAELVRLRAEGTISAEVMRRLERELDLEDQRLEI